MLKVIELQIEDALSGDTGVWEVAWVEYPAIEEELMYFGRQKFYRAPVNVSKVACQAIKENEKRDNKAATQVGKVRAQQLCKRETISLETINRMKSYLERAKVYNTDDWDDKGTISWKLWGGREGLEWVDSILSTIKEDMALEDACWEGYEPIGMKEKDGKLVPNCVPIQQSREKFVKPNIGETKDEYISRCIPYVLNEGASQEQAAGKCYGMWDNKFGAGDKVSFDYDDTLSTDNGRELAKKEIESGSIVYIISARNSVDRMLGTADDLGIPQSRVYATGSNKAKVEKIKELGITKHYDNNKDVIDELGNVGIQFDYDIAALPDYNNYPNSGDTDAMMVKPFLGEAEDCGCDKEVFGLMGYIDGEPIFSTQQEAEAHAVNKGCVGSHEHRDSDGNLVYMACETHPTELNTIVAKDYIIKSIGGQENIDVIFSSEYTDDEKEALVLLAELGETNYEVFERVVGSLRGATLEQVKRRNHKTATPYYLYKKVLNGEPTRDFCDSIEGRYFRRVEIDLLDGLNTQFGHNQQPYSKWNYKGGPNCNHAFYRVLAIGSNITELGPEPGLPGTPPMNMPNNGYYSEETKRASEVAYIISQQNMSKIEFDLIGDLTPLGYVSGLPIYDDELIAADASYAIGCGGIYESVMFEGKQRFQACSYKAQKKEKGDALFRAVVEKKMIYTPLMVPNILIPRLDEITGERYFVKFSPETIEKIQQKFMIEQRLRDTNYEHTDMKFQDLVMVESWLVDGTSDKSYSLGYTPQQIPKGTWMAGYKVLDTDEGNDVWNKYIKTGKVKGASVEGNFILNFSRSNNDDYLLEQIINILKEIK
jgi:hypothetical protein